MRVLTRWAAATLLCFATTLGEAQAADKIVISNWDAYMPADLLALEALRDVGDAMKLYSRTVTEITASE